MQYTIRNVPKNVDIALRRRARAVNRSINEVVLEALARGIDVNEVPVRRDLSAVAGAWHEDPAFDAALAALHVVDEAHET